MTLAEGSILENRYRIEAILNQKGGMGIVYRARHIELDIPLAIKENLFISLEAQQQFQEEARLLARLSPHANLPRVSDHFFVQDRQYLVMDFIDGEDLSEILDKRGILPESDVLRLTEQICSALSFLHQQPHPIIHRDVKPHNIKICSDGRVVLVDFGIAKVYQPDSSTQAGARGISSGYSSPEQQFRERTDTRSDIYSLGATLYHLLTGSKPPDSLKLYSEPLIPPYKFNSQISPSLEQAILKAMALDKEHRFQSVEEFHKFIISSMAEHAPNASTEFPTSQITTRKKRAVIDLDTRTDSGSLLGKQKLPVLSKYEYILHELENHIERFVDQQSRYPVMWITGQPCSGKTHLMKNVCQRKGWQYIDFTLEPGYLDTFIGQEEQYRPEDFLEKLRLLCKTLLNEVVIIDEIEPLLSLWKRDEQDIFFNIYRRMTRFRCRIIFITRLRTAEELMNILPGPEHVFEIPQGVIL